MKKFKFFRFLFAVILPITALIINVSPVIADGSPIGEVKNSYVSAAGGVGGVVQYSGNYHSICGQTFNATESYYATGATVHIKAYNSPTFDCTIGIREVNSVYYPVGDLLCSTTFDSSELDTSYHWYHFNFDSYGEIEAGTDYVLVIESYSGGSLNNAVYWDMDVGGDISDGCYIYDGSPATLWVSDLGHVDTYDLGYKVYGLEIEPINVFTNISTPKPDGIYISGHYSNTDLSILETSFQIGTSSGNYTENWTATSTTSFDDYTQFSVTLPTENFTLGDIYYYRAQVQTNYGWIYGQEESLVFYPTFINVTLTDASYVQHTSGNFSAGFTVVIEPIYASTNVTARMSDDYLFSDEVELYCYGSQMGVYLFSSWNGTYGVAGTLLPETTYYYQGIATTDLGTVYYSEIKEFTTDNYTIPDKPEIEIIKIEDVGASYGFDYGFEVTCKIITSNTTDNVNYQGIRFSQYSSGGLLLPEIKSYNIYSVATDGTFTGSFVFDNLEDYSGGTIYFQGYIVTPYYGEIYSKISSTKPYLDDSSDSDSNIVTSFDDTITNVRNNLGLHGVMGTWAFMGLLLLIVALIFGVIYYTAKTSEGKMAIGIIWGLISIAIVGGFVFTGELGLWPILILVGAVVLLVLVIGGRKLSGGES